jgi:serine/threonine protein kinase
VLITADNHIRLTDFGLATDSSPLAMTFCGSPAYLSPEMLKRKGVTYKADIYGFGTILYEMLCGYPPYYCNDIQMLFQRIKHAKLKFPKYTSIEARDICKRLLDRDPSCRPEISEVREHGFFL